MKWLVDFRICLIMRTNFEKVWSAATLIQALHRSDRQGQTRNISIYFYLIDNSIDIYTYLCFLLHFNINRVLYSFYSLYFLPQKFIDSYGNLSYIKRMSFEFKSILNPIDSGGLYLLKEVRLLPIAMEISNLNDLWDSNNYYQLLNYKDNLIEDENRDNDENNYNSIIKSIEDKYKVLILLNVEDDSISIFISSLLQIYKDNLEVLLFINNNIGRSSTTDEVGCFIASFSPPLSALCFMNIKIIKLMISNNDRLKVQLIKSLYTEKYFETLYNDQYGKYDKMIINKEFIDNMMDNNQIRINNSNLTINDKKELLRISTPSFRKKVIKAIVDFLNQFHQL